MKNKILLPILTCLFVLLFGATVFVSYSGNIVENEVVVKSITPLYDVSSEIVVDQKGVIFNDKNQVVDYKVIIENTQDYDVKINNISLTTPTEEFLKYEVEGIQKEDILKANSTKEITISLETMGIKGWGRNFSDELTANVSFEKVTKQEEPTPPAEDDEEETPKEDEKNDEGSNKPEVQPEAPAKNKEELIKNEKEIEIKSITTDTIEFNEDIKVEVGEKIAVWIYPETKFLGYFDVIVENDVKKIKGLEEELKKITVETGDHDIVLVSESEETLGYINVYIDENKQLLTEKPEEENVVENPYTSDNKLVIVLISATAITGLAIVIVSKNKFAKYTIFILMLSPVLTTSAEKSIELPIKFNISFESQNVMKPSGWGFDLGDSSNNGDDFWLYSTQIKNIYIQNEITEIKEYEHEFDVTEEQNGRVKAYLVNDKENSVCTDLEGNELNCFDLYIQADGIIYPNKNMDCYFVWMLNLNTINNLVGLDTSEVTSMYGIFGFAGALDTDFELDISTFNTSNVTDMSYMFAATGGNSEVFTLNLGDKFDTSNVTNMSYMFYSTGNKSTVFTLDLGDKFDTSNVTDMNYMFAGAGYKSTAFTLDLEDKFDTSNVTNMSHMFYSTGASSPVFTLNLGDKFDTSNVTDMEYMFFEAGYSNPDFELNVSNFDTSKVTNMSYMFGSTGYKSTKFTLNVSDFDTSKVTNMSGMFEEAGYSNPDFELNVSNFDLNNVTDFSYMFNKTGYNSTKLNVSITISNPNITAYRYMFKEVATKTGSQIKVNYTAETEELVKKMIATKSTNSNVVLGNLIVDVDKLSIGNEIHISGEKFNVISQTDDTVTMLAQYNLSTDYRQSTTANPVKFADTYGWEYRPGPKEIDIQVWSTNPKTYINAYVDYLKNTLKSDAITGDLIKLFELGNLGCTIPTDYAWGSGEWTCTNSEYNNWLVNEQKWVTQSATPDVCSAMWIVYENGKLSNGTYVVNSGIRPVITIPKDTLKKLNN